MRITTLSGLTIRMCEFPRPVPMGSVTYQPVSGYDFTNFDATSSMQSSSMDITGIIGRDGVTRAAVAMGLFDHASIKVFAADWRNPVEDAEPIIEGFMGKVSFDETSYKVELFSKLDLLNSIQPMVYMATCYKEFAGTGFAGCKKVATTFNGTVTAVSNQYTITDATLNAAADFYKEGLLTWTSGNNLNAKPLEIKTQSTGGAITTHEPWQAPIAVGDTFTLKEGCLKTHAACIAKNNVLNFGGFPFIPTSGEYVVRGGYDR